MTIEDLVKNKSELKRLKTNGIKHSEGISYLGKSFETKSVEKDGLSENEVNVVIVGNTYGWCDSDSDVLMNNCFKRSIKENTKNVFHLNSHQFKIDAKVGIIQDLYEQNVLLKDLGLNMNGEAQCLIAKSAVKKLYNEKIYEMYKSGDVNQHSVGMIYEDLYLCVNNEDYKDEFKAWNKYFESVINKDKVLNQGYFWAVTSAKLVEISCVLMGANVLTPTLEIEQTKQESMPQIAASRLTSKQKANIIRAKFFDYYFKN